MSVQQILNTMTQLIPRRMSRRLEICHGSPFGARRHQQHLVMERIKNVISSKYSEALHTRGHRRLGDLCVGTGGNRLVGCVLMDVARLASLASEIDTAAGRIAAFSSETPLLRIPELDRRTQGEVYLKAECLQPTGSFKIRGA